MAGLGAGELLIVLAVLLLIFGAKKLPQLARSMGQAGKEFKAGVQEGGSTPLRAVEGPCPYCGENVAAESKFCAGCGKSSEEIIEQRALLAQKTA